MQKGNVFIGCELGTKDTDTALMFDYLFDPQQELYDNGLNGNNYMYLINGRVENLYNKLTDSDKQKMNWPKDFDQTFFKRLAVLKEEAYRRYGIRV